MYEVWLFLETVCTFKIWKNCSYTGRGWEDIPCFVLMEILSCLFQWNYFCKKFYSYYNIELVESPRDTVKGCFPLIWYAYCPQVVSNRDTQETLLCIAYVFEVSTSEHGAQHHIYKLVKDWCVAVIQCYIDAEIYILYKKIVCCYFYMKITMKIIL